MKEEIIANTAKEENKNNVREKNKLILEKLNHQNDTNVSESYEYLDENKKPYIKVERFKKGGFRVLSYSSEKGTYEKGLNGLKPIPYNLPELNSSKKDIVFIANGERDVNTLKELGFLSTTFFGNSPEKWNPQYNYLLKKKGVLIMQDNSVTARAFAQNTEAKLAFKDDVARVPIESLAKMLSVKIGNNSDITKVRKLLNNDEQLITALENLKEQLNSLEEVE